MESPFTGGKVIRQVREEELEFRGDTFKIPYTNYKCVDTEEEFTTNEIDTLNLALLHNAYREKHNIPFPNDILEIREKYGASQRKMSEILGFGPNSYGNYENGDVPQLNNAKLISIASKPNGFIELVNECDSLKESYKEKYIKKAESLRSVSSGMTQFLFKVQEPCSLNGYMKPSIEKFSDMVSYLSEDTEIYKVKLNKLLFYSDNLHFKNHGQSISGTAYQAIQMGPVPHKYGTLFEFGEELGRFTIERVQFENYETEGEKFTSINNSYDSLTKKELETLAFTKDHLANFSTRDLIRISHEEKGWIENEKDKGLIDYRFAVSLKYPD
ncbi:type II TA system antitoxin MqsA family protein [Gracilimonas amylolytica]|uniref:type II TA system antitoxin MqsA family protein n=1 Tax=Gracilimonas amylolytica TaxID=1749045 RepID=UPI000CD8CE3F|nr:type II TA system antitoxin MqsA family protein [Gracilimonas amylolytica]